MGCERMSLGGDDERLPLAMHTPRLEQDSDTETEEEEEKRESAAQRRPPSAWHAVENEELHSDDTDIEEEMMRIDPVDVEWRRQLHASDPVDAQNIFGNWCPAMILRILDGEAQIRFLNMNDSWQRWVPLDSGQLAPPATKTRNDSAPLRLAQMIEVRKPGTTMWKEAHVVKARPHDILVRYAGREQQFDEWIPYTPDTVAATGTTSAQNPRFVHYRDALASEGLQIRAVEGDGNCLFRAVSHQVYGDDQYHGLVRRLCMDYMESEKEYFEPYVVGDMSDFLRYLEHKRRDGVWGDDPEIQAMCELYDRPAEVFAYDPVNGCRKLRTFHENRSLSRSRPSICLSYYGGGHYDSLVGPNHVANIIQETPGEWEQRHIEYSRRINTREGATGVLQRVQAASDRESTEVAQLEHILMVSRNEFDAMHSSLDESLKLTLAESEATAVHSEQRALDVATQESEMAAIQAELLEKARQESEEELMRKAIVASLQEPAHDFDAQVSAAIQASLVETVPPVAEFVDEEEEMRRILELSAKEYEQAAMYEAVPTAFLPPSHDEDEDMDELQRAIQASLQES
ncbi:hypothetical protein Poli38472_002479 [Pythium oligandrum]|uniref:ubiquitinyl hydrolase 1 n=1 Tax=Pythium oligandrum TaxID=41045 RepID=A0A8K1FMD0_PYTOL|nr:hypothetical protein Poli38472_002479 [Pythium oligandrum]|eukprot:TMW63538.1 hypothetical protein Poli38472_002479 [Pythium oligandrum]